MSYVIPFLGAGLFAFAAYGDVRIRRIPNELAIAVAALGLIQLILGGDLGAALHSLTAAAAVLAAGFLLFWRGYVGGGDVKLAAAAVLLVGYHGLSGFLLAMGLCGLVVTLAILAAHRMTNRTAAAPQIVANNPPLPRRTVPYGVAIAAAGILSLVLQSPV